MEEWDWLISILEKGSEVQKPDEPRGALEASVTRDWSGGDSEYEYEYDESELETFYVNVDLNSSGWLGVIPQPAADKAAVPMPEQMGTSESIPGVQPAEEFISDSPLTRSRSRPSKIQISDLHCNRPIVKYQNQVFECRWANMIGTDLLILPANADFDGPILKECQGFKEPKGRVYPGFKVVAANSVKLISQKFTVAEKREDPGQPGADQDTDEFFIPKEATENRRNQTEFLKRYTDLKRGHGDGDKVPTHSQKAMNATGPKTKKNTPAPEADTGQSSTNTEVSGNPSVMLLDQAIHLMHASIDEDSRPPVSKRRKSKGDVM